MKNHKIDWGIELLILGRKVGEHVDRFAEMGKDGKPGKYVGLKCTDHIVIDFRWGEATHQVLKDEKKMTVFFNSTDFKTCSYIMGLSGEIVRLELNK